MFQLFRRLVVAIESIAESQRGNLDVQRVEMQRRLAFDEKLMAGQERMQATVEKSVSPVPSLPVAIPAPKKSS